jgi:hypothetical protein
VGAAAKRQAIFNAIETERHAQDDRWGGPDHDNQHGPLAWVGFIVKQLGKAVSASQDPAYPIGPKAGGAYRRALIKAAALVVAAIEVHDRC